MRLQCVDIRREEAQASVAELMMEAYIRTESGMLLGSDH